MCSMSPVTASLSLQNHVIIPVSLLVKSGSVKNILFSETPSLLLEESKTTLLFFLEWNMYAPNSGVNTNTRHRRVDLE